MGATSEVTLAKLGFKKPMAAHLTHFSREGENLHCDKVFLRVALATMLQATCLRIPYVAASAIAASGLQAVLHADKLFPFGAVLFGKAARVGHKGGAREARVG
eukprot:7165-Heterococcus_DN1.PRE.1